MHASTRHIAAVFLARPMAPRSPESARARLTPYRRDFALCYADGKIAEARWYLHHRLTARAADGVTDYTHGGFVRSARPYYHAGRGNKARRRARATSIRAALRFQAHFGHRELGY